MFIDEFGAATNMTRRYSPDFNPIEMAISKMKSLLRKLERRSIETLETAVAQAMRSITRNDARGFIQHCGYADTII